MNIMKHTVGTLVVCIVVHGFPNAAWSGEPAKSLRVYTDPEHVDDDFKFQGEYVGDVTQTDGTKMKLGAQVRSLSNGAFRTVFFRGGLPGDGWDGNTIIQKMPSTDDVIPSDSKLENGKVNVDHLYKAIVDGQAIRGQTDAGAKFELNRVNRVSPTMGAKAPDGAIVLFDGTNTDQWKKGAILTPQKLLGTGPTTKGKYQDYALHVEFMISYVPGTQDINQRPNSGVFLQQRYEIQILDSFGVTMGDHDCGVLYAQVTPKINVCYPPLSWQTYDIDFAAARFDETGKKTKNARCTVKFNGVVILDDVEILHPTPSGTPESAEASGIYLQAHGLPVFFRNIWLVEHK